MKTIVPDMTPFLTTPWSSSEPPSSSFAMKRMDPPEKVPSSLSPLKSPVSFSPACSSFSVKYDGMP